MTYRNYSAECDVSVLLGRTLSAIERNGDDKILFTTTDGERFRMTYYADCCASCSIEDVVGDLDSLVGSPLTMAECATNSDNPKPDADSHTWTFYKFATIRGYVTIRWYGESNGYYSETATFERVSK